MDGPLTYRRREDIAFDTGSSALGPILVASSDEGVVAILCADRVAELVGQLRERFKKANLLRDVNAVRPHLAAVRRFVASPDHVLDLPLDLRGTPFQKRVWEEVQRIPPGETSTYSRIAELVGAPKAIRAVASTCTSNGLYFAIPCHRVLHKDGKGYGGTRQKRLLAREVACANASPGASSRPNTNK